MTTHHYAAPFTADERVADPQAGGVIVRKLPLNWIIGAIVAALMWTLSMTAAGTAAWVTMKFRMDDATTRIGVLEARAREGDQRWMQVVADVAVTRSQVSDIREALTGQRGPHAR
jgi:hypothetical protein